MNQKDECREGPVSLFQQASDTSKPMRILVNGLSATSLSGHHVLLGHLAQLAYWTRNQHQYAVLYDGRNRGLHRPLGANVSWLEAPGNAGGWVRRSLWELTSFNRLLRRQAIQLVFSPSGTIVPNCDVPQMTLAQNPWCLTPAIHRSLAERGRAALQRRVYRFAERHAAVMLYNSYHIQDHYRQLTRRTRTGPSLVVYQAIDDSTHQAAAESRGRVQRKEFEILAVSAMAHWKNIETTVAAVRLLHDRGLPARLTLVGPWPDPPYRQFIEEEISRQALASHVEITGKVSRAQLHGHYARASIFCLMSRCESFGIPAVEAQAFGTPVVGSDCCAMPEVCGAGGRFCAPDDADGVADALAALLEDRQTWATVSNAAASNAAKYRWSRCTRPLLEALQQHTGRMAGPRRAA
jgi:glycosyltransferase involved in cell wall biosynthesis